MSLYTPHWAPIVVLAFLGIAFLVIASVVVALIGVLCKARRVALAGISAALGMTLVYGTMLLGFSLALRQSPAIL